MGTVATWVALWRAATPARRRYLRRGHPAGVVPSLRSFIDSSSHRDLSRTLCSPADRLDVTFVTPRPGGCRALPPESAVKVRSKILKPPHRTGEVASDLLVLVGTAGFEPATP